MAEKKKTEPVKLPLNPTDALRALLQVKPPSKGKKKEKEKSREGNA